MTAYQDFVRSEMSGFHGTRVQMNLKMKEVGARWRAHKSGAGVQRTRGRGLQSDIKSALANVDFNQLKNIDYSKAGQYITGSGVRRVRKTRGYGLESDIKSALQNVDLNQLKNIDYAQAKQYITGSGLKITRRRNNVVRRRNNVVKKSGKGIFGSMLGQLLGSAVGGLAGNKDLGGQIGQGAGAFLPF